jgi:hypothetical protein
MARTHLDVAHVVKVGEESGESSDTPPMLDADLGIVVTGGGF